MCTEDHNKIEVFMKVALSKYLLFNLLFQENDKIDENYDSKMILLKFYNTYESNVSDTIHCCPGNSSAPKKSSNKLL